MKYSFLIIALFFFAACNGNHFDKQTYAQNKTSLTDKERSNPLNFLKISGDEHKNFLTFGKTVVKGTVTNMATVCAYKDVRVKMLSFDKNKKMLEEHEDVMDDVVKPGTSIDFKTKYRLPKTVDSIALSIMSAVPVSDSTKK